MKKEEEIKNPSFESDGIMGKENIEKKSETKEKEFFNITPQSE